MAKPLISIVTPSYNQVQYLEQTLTSVLGQQYPNLEYIVMDGGSNDGSTEVLRRYAPQLAFWRSAKDGGQAAAINAGFQRAKGDILAWVNSDDMYLPGTLAVVAEKLDVSRRQLFVSNVIHFNEVETASWPSNVEAARREHRLELFDYVPQAGAFWTRACWEAAGQLDESLRFAFDWDWFIRAARASEVVVHPRFSALYRIHPDHKSGTGGGARQKELVEVTNRYAGRRYADFREWVTPVREECAFLVRAARKAGLSATNSYRVLWARFPRQTMGFTAAELRDMIGV